MARGRAREPRTGRGNGRPNPLPAQHPPAAKRHRKSRQAPAPGGSTAPQPSHASYEIADIAGLPTTGPELFFGLVGPVGTNLELVISVLQEQLELVRYKSIIVHLSRLLDWVPGLISSQPDRLDKYYKTYMDAGNAFRQRCGSNDAVVLLSIMKIRHERRKITKDPEVAAKRRAYILRSLKHEDEAESLRKIYGRAFYLIAAYAPRESRIDSLSKRIADSYHDTSKQKYRSAAEDILNRDEEEEDVTGQHVRKVFPKADIFVDATSRQSIADSLSRFVALIFGNPFITPSHDEFSMFLAKAAAYRSADLSRQVGAVITTDESDVIGVGCNEVPKAFGGQYWENDRHDARDWRLGYDPSTRMKREILAETLSRLKTDNWFSKKFGHTSVDQMLKSCEDETLTGTQLLDLIEFGRIIHAEMAAIVDAARRGNKVQGSILYCTTFPCHMCARHIIGAGIKQVVFIEPYPKSKVEDLYRDSVAVEGTGVADKISFSAFVGISPTTYQELFEMPKRKDKDGSATKWERAKSSPRLERIVLAYVFLETLSTKKFGNLVEETFGAYQDPT